MSTTNRSGRSSRSRRTGAGWSSSAAWFPTHASVCWSLQTRKSTSRFALGAGIVTRGTQAGVYEDAAFWK